MDINARDPLGEAGGTEPVEYGPDAPGWSASPDPYAAERAQLPELHADMKPTPEREQLGSLLWDAPEEEEQEWAPGDDGFGSQA